MEPLIVEVDHWKYVLLLPNNISTKNVVPIPEITVFIKLAVFKISPILAPH